MITSDNTKTAKKLTNFPVFKELRDSANPVVEYKTRKLLLEECPNSVEMATLRNSIAECKMAKQLLSLRNIDGRIATNPYKKWQGPHWTLYCLSQISYPAGRIELQPMKEQIYKWLFEEKHLRFPRSLLIEGQENRFRRCASQEGNAIWYSIVLGIEDDRTHQLVERLIKWQWPDGGWNCDKRKDAVHSSMIESCVPLRALMLYGTKNQYSPAIESAEKTAEFILKHKLLYQLHDGKEMDPDFLKIHYPIQFYDVLFALVVMAEINKINDSRCKPALDLLIRKQLPDGGLPLEIKNCKTTPKLTTRGSSADWGPSGKKMMNPYVTISALYVLKKAGII